MSPKGSKPTICVCPFTDWCEDGRQRLQTLFRKENENYTVKDCDFYKMIRKKTAPRIPTKPGVSGTPLTK